MNNPMIREDMIKIYRTNSYDWLGDKITKKNSITYHHIVKAEDGGNETIENGALLTIKSHSLIHQIELIDSALYGEVSYWLRTINDLRVPINEEIKTIMIVLRKRMIAVKEYHNLGYTSLEKNNLKISNYCANI